MKRGSKGRQLARGTPPKRVLVFEVFVRGGRHRCANNSLDALACPNMDHNANFLFFFARGGLFRAALGGLIPCDGIVPDPRSSVEP